MPVIEFKEITKIYKMGDVQVHALKSISFSIEHGDYVIIMGPSGSGKSTLLQILGCLDRPSSGEISIDGTQTSKMNEDQLAKVRNRKIGFVFQGFNLLPKLTALENTMLPMIYGNVYKGKERTERAKELLQDVGLIERINHRPNQLSGGQQQRVAIARALSNNPSIILADEPTGNLDTQSGKEILEIFGRLNSSGKTVIIVTHDPDMAKKGNKLIKLRDGLIEKIEVTGIGNT